MAGVVRGVKAVVLADSWPWDCADDDDCSGWPPGPVVCADTASAADNAKTTTKEPVTLLLTFLRSPACGLYLLTIMFVLLNAPCRRRTSIASHVDQLIGNQRA